MVVAGGTYYRSNDVNYPATVSDFRLDRFEITVGRFRAFVEVYPGSRPKAGAGAHPLIAGSGWDSAWDASLPLDQATLIAALKCGGMQRWTDPPSGNETLPMNCITWYDAFAFCAWDGGRLPTEAEWNYAAAGGEEQRVYPWSNPPSSTTIASTYAVYDSAPIAIVGSKPAGDGKWGQADLSGNMWEWNLDGDADTYPHPKPDTCNDCADIQTFSPRIFRGGGWKYDASYMLSSFRYSDDPAVRYDDIGVRCARTP
jgi:formylglycine-generating enzyme required for sulfatase activity